MSTNNGERRSNYAKRCAIVAVLDGRDGEKLSNRQAAARAGLSHHLVHIVGRDRASGGT